MIKDFSSWKKYDGAEGSGRSEKIWLENCKDCRKGLFKFKKDENTKDHISEKLASEIAGLLDIPCAEIDIGTYENRDGSMSYLINKNNEILIEGISLINKIYPNYDAQAMYDSELKEYYSLEMLERSIEGYGIQVDLLNMLIFDFLIGNSDRHQNNWAIISGGSGKYRFSPLYDNSSSLCCYVLEDKVENFLGNDLNRINALVSNKSKSIVRIDKDDSRRPKHEDVIKIIYEKYKYVVNELIEKIKKEINSHNIDKLLSGYDDGLLSGKRKRLIELFLLKKVEILSKITREGE